VVYPRGLPLPAAPGVSRFCWVGATADFFLQSERYRLGWVTTVDVTHPTPIRVLIVDDEPAIVRLIRDYLERAGFDVMTAGNGEDALQVFSRSRPDLVILDLTLPHMDGLDVAWVSAALRGR